MRTPRERVRPVGLTVLYEPDEPTSTGIGLDVILVHGLGGDPVRTWLHGTDPAPSRASPHHGGDAEDGGKKPARRAPARSRSLIGWARGNTLKKQHNTTTRMPSGLADQSSRSRSAEPSSTNITRQREIRPSKSATWSHRLENGKKRLKVSVTVEEQPPEPHGKETYWPQDLLPLACPHARVLTWGFDTLSVDGALVPGQLDLFARARDLLEDMKELRRPRTNGQPEAGREIVFVAHSTGGIIVKEILRLASSFSDTYDESLLASLSGILFLACPLRDTTHGSMVVAMKSMAALTTGVLVDDHALQELLGGTEDACLANLGRDCLEAVWSQYNFKIKTYQEAALDQPLASWAEMALALRRDTSVLEASRAENEEMAGDHLQMCRFASGDDAGFRSIASFIGTLTHYQTLKDQQLTERDTSNMRALAEATPRRHPATRASPRQTGPRVPAWLLGHPHFQWWMHRSDPEKRHRLLRISGPMGSGRSELLASIHAHLHKHWSPETHSSAILTVKAEDAQSLVQALLSGNDADVGGGEGHSDSRRAPLASVLETKPPDPQKHQRHATSSTPANALRSILSQLYPHDPRLRNLVRKRLAHALAARSLPEEAPEPDTGNVNVDVQGSSSLKSQVKGIVAHNNGSGGGGNNRPDEIGAHNRRWSDPANNDTGNLLVGAQTQDCRVIQEGAEAARANRLTDADVVSLFLEDYLCLDLARERSGASGKSGNNDDSKQHSTIDVPGIRRIFILVDAVDSCSNGYLRELLWCLGQLARTSEFSVCVAAPDIEMKAVGGGHGGDATPATPSGSENELPIMITDNNHNDIKQYVDKHLVTDIAERDAITSKMLDKADGLVLWAKMVVDIVNTSSDDGVSGEVILGMLDDIAPPYRDSNSTRLDDLYAWKLQRLSVSERAQALVLMRWIVLVSEPLHLNELQVALRLTLLTSPGGQGGSWDASKALDIEPPMSLNDLRKYMPDEQGIAMDSPTVFWRWIQHVSQGLLRLEPEPEPEAARKAANEPLGLQRVLPLHESVQKFFLKGRGFVCLSPEPPEAHGEQDPAGAFIDKSYYALLHACLKYLNMTELDSLGRGQQPLDAVTGKMPESEAPKWRQYARDQRKLVMSSYPFLRYAVDNLVFHLLCPRMFRYFLPQKELLELFMANRCRIWRRWVNLLGFNIADADPGAILGKVGGGAAEKLLDPVFGARYRLERVLRKVWKTALDQQRARVATPRRAATLRAHMRSRSEATGRASAQATVFTLVGSDGPLKSQWMLPPNPRSRSNSSPARPRSPLGPAAPSGLGLVGIQEAA